MSSLWPTPDHACFVVIAYRPTVTDAPTLDTLTGKGWMQTRAFQARMAPLNPPPT
ncbi:hypothetical protein [Nocardia sp. CA-119907]|uniref:hypothetical protein n=1 Tax=Nocardia sp. CA-119907 TaxID=3239973 RepID=UPI003D96E983